MKTVFFLFLSVADGLKFLTRVPAEALYILYMHYTRVHTHVHTYIVFRPINCIGERQYKKVSSILVDIDHIHFAEKRVILILGTLPNTTHIQETKTAHMH